MEDRFLSIFYVILLSVPLSAQSNEVTIEANLMDDSDKVVLQEIPYFYAGTYGTKVFWNFSDIDIEGKEHKIYYYKDTLDRHVAFGPDGVTYLNLQTDTLFISSNETPLSRIVYNKPLMLMRYPHAYGDSVSAPFCGYGVYCGDHPFREHGVSTVIADADGSIILDDDTIPNVLRVFTLKSYSICMDIDSAALDTAKLKQVIEERYDWYARCYRYPLFTTVTSTSYDNMKAIGTSQKAYCMLPKSQKLQNAPYNQAIRNKDSLSIAGRNNANEEIFHYVISQDGNLFSISYSLDEPADITALVSDVMGIVEKQRHQYNMAGSDYTLTIDCKGLRPGKYILYLNVNGNVFNEKMTIR